MVSMEPLVVKLARAQNEIESLQAVVSDLDRRNKMMLGFFQKVLKPKVEAIIKAEEHPCVAGKCEHGQAEQWKCRAELLDLIKAHVTASREMLKPQ